jgi:hypothetical protein
VGTVKVYNSAGELVGTLYGALPLYQMPTGLAPVVGAFAPDQAGAGVLKLVGPNLPLVWSGTSDNGQLVASGTYSVVVQVKDSFGGVSTWTQSLTVLRTDSSTSVEIYNSAGELVWSQRLQPTAPGLVSLSSRELVPDSSGPGIKITYGSGATDSVIWNGTGSNGQAVASGTYLVKVTQRGSSGQSSSSYDVTVIQANSQPFDWVAAAPNPVPPGTGSVLVSLQGMAPGVTAWGEVYNLAGEHVGSLSLYSAGNLRWDLSPSIAPGVYLIEVSASDSQGRFKRSLVKVALVR